MLLPLYLIWHFLFVVAIAPNLILLVLNVKKARQMAGRPYNVFLVDMTAGDILISFGLWFAMPCSLPAGETKPTIYFGFCQYLGPLWCFHSQRISQHIVYNNTTIILASFIARRRILLQGGFTYYEASLIAFLAYLPAAISLIIEYGIPTEVGVHPGSNQLFQNISLPVDDFFPYMNLQLGSWQGIASGIIAPILILISCSFSFLLRWRLKLALSKSAPNAMSPATKILHLSLIKTLSLQTCIPLVTLVSGIFYNLFSYGTSLAPYLYYSPITNSISFFTSMIIPLLNSCTALYYIPAYRRTLKKFMAMEKSSRISNRTHPTPSTHGTIRIESIHSITPL